MKHGKQFSAIERYVLVEDTNYGQARDRVFDDRQRRKCDSTTRPFSKRFQLSRRPSADHERAMPSGTPLRYGTSLRGAPLG